MSEIIKTQLFDRLDLKPDSHLPGDSADRFTAKLSADPLSADVKFQLYVTEKSV